MGLKLEVGKCYKTRDGRKVGPMVDSERHDGHFYVEGLGLFTSDGVFGWVSAGVRSAPAPSLDLIAEWTDAPTGPVRTVTRKEIVPGSYGHIWAEPLMSEVDGVVDYITCDATFTAAELRAAIATLTEIADAMEEQ